MNTEAYEEGRTSKLSGTTAVNPYSKRIAAYIYEPGKPTTFLETLIQQANEWEQGFIDAINGVKRI